MKVELFSNCPCTVAEGPRVHDGFLYWVDVTLGDVYRQRLDAPPDGFERMSPGLGKIGAITFAADGRLRLYAAGCKVYETEFGGEPVLAATLPDRASTRFNDVYEACDYVSFCGVAPAPDDPSRRGELWRFDAREESFTCVCSATAGMPNGMGVSKDRYSFYFTVTDEGRIYAYGWDRDSMELLPRAIFLENIPGPGNPDGMCVDPADGSLWIAFWDGSRLEHRAADGSLIESVPFPMPRVTSAAATADAVYVTTANYPTDEKAYRELHAGCVFRLVKDGGTVA